MDSSFTIKPRDSASRVVYDRTSTVRTDLSPAQSVGAPQAVPPLRNGQGPSDLTPRGVAIDPQSQDVIRRARDEDERRKRQKHSDEALVAHARLSAVATRDRTRAGSGASARRRQSLSADHRATATNQIVSETLPRSWVANHECSCCSRAPSRRYGNTSINHVFLRGLGWLREMNAADPMDRHV